MTREDARKAAEVMLAYADGKNIEHRFSEEWTEIENPGFDWSFGKYRIKPEPTYRPFKDVEECWDELRKRSEFWLCKRNDPGLYRFVVVLDDGSYLKTMFEEMTFSDGTPFGVKIEEKR